MSAPVRIPADVELPDRLIGPLTARQVAILAVTGLVLYTGWTLTRALVPMPVFLALAIPLAASTAAVALGQRDGISLDRLLLAAIRQHLAGRHRLAAPENAHPAPAWLRAAATGHDPTASGSAVPHSATRLCLPAQAVTDTGVIDLGDDGLALVAVASTVNFALRTPTEQEALVASFAHYLHSLGAPVQITYWSGSYNAQVGANSFRQPLVPRGIEGQHAPNRLCQQSELLFAIRKTGRLRHDVPVHVSIALLAAQAEHVQPFVRHAAPKRFADPMHPAL